MGSIFKRIKKTFKKVTKPLSKMTKGIARGIAKVGKAVMKGVSKISSKLGPLGMIGLAVAMPYALGGLSNMIGHGGMAAGQASGWMGSQNVFLKAIGNVGNVIRTGYSNATGAIGRTFGNITKSISKGFSKFTNNTGNIWKNISKGTKNLFNNARNTFNNFKKGLKLPGKDLGTVNVSGQTPWGAQYTTMTSEQAGSLIQGNAMNAANLSGQTLGSRYDKLITDTINSSFDKSGWDSGTIRRFNDAKKFTQANKSYVNDYDLFQGLNNQGQSYHAGTKSWTTDLGKTGDYAKTKVGPDNYIEYQFTGDKSFNNPVAKKYNYKDTLKKGYTYAKAASDSLLKQSEMLYAPEFDMIATAGAEANQQGEVLTSSTDIVGSGGSSNYAKVFGDTAWHKLKAYHKNMNYQGSF